MNLVLMTREEYDQALSHHGVKGQKRGIRQYQNEDGSLTPLGRIHYGIGLGRDRSSNHGKTGIILGKKQVNSDGSLTKNGVKAVEESGKNGYMNISDSDKKSGKADHRLEVIRQMNDESDKSDPERKSGNNILSVSKEIYDKYKDKYAEATLKDLKLPVNEANKGVVKDFFSRYSSYYDWDAGNLSTEESEKRQKEFADRWNKRFSKDLDEKSTKEIKKDVKEHIDSLNDIAKEKRKDTDVGKLEKTIADKAKKGENASSEITKLSNAEAEKSGIKKELNEIRSLADEELNKRINRLQREKQYAELLNERANREKGPVYEVVSKLFKDAGMKLAQKALDRTGDELLKKLFPNGNSGNNQQNNQNQNQKQNNQGSSNGQKFSKGEKSQIRSMAGSGKSIADIAKALGTTEDKVKNYMSAAGITIS